ncbi:cysteine-rich CWC family protein, partial [Proteiniphilum sp. UBA5384]
MEKKCPRCGNKFECKPDDIFSCECADIYIPPNLAFQIDSI